MNTPEGLRAHLVAHLPIFTWWPAYDRSRLGRDALAGPVVAALAVPQSLGYASHRRSAGPGGPVRHPGRAGGVRDLRHRRGSWSSDRCRRCRCCRGRWSPASGCGHGSGRVVHGSPGAGLACLGRGSSRRVPRIGWVAEFLSKPIVTGFVLGLTVLVILGELPNLLGRADPAGPRGRAGRAPGREPRRGRRDRRPCSSGPSRLLVLFGGPRLAPRVPWGLVLLVGGARRLRPRWTSLRGVEVVGRRAARACRRRVPAVGSARRLIPSVLVSAARPLPWSGLAEGLSAARLFAAGGGYRIDADQELLASGVANVGSGLVRRHGGRPAACRRPRPVRAAPADGEPGDGPHRRRAVPGVIVAIAPALSLPEGRAVARSWSTRSGGSWTSRRIRRYARVRRNDIVAAHGRRSAGSCSSGRCTGCCSRSCSRCSAWSTAPAGSTSTSWAGSRGEKAAWGSVSRHPERRTVRRGPGAARRRADLLGQRGCRPRRRPRRCRRGARHPRAGARPGVHQPAGHHQRGHAERPPRATSGREASTSTWCVCSTSCAGC